MKGLSLLLGMILLGWPLAIPIACAATAHGFLSWDQCSPIVHDKHYTGPVLYRLVVGVKDLQGIDPVIGSHVCVLIGPEPMDAWRFDAAGCESNSRLAYSQTAPEPSCPVLAGTNPGASSTIAHVSTGGRYDDPAKFPEELIQLDVIHDPVTPVAGQTYVLWTLVFDLTYTAGEDDDGNPLTCDGASRPVCLYMEQNDGPYTLRYSSNLFTMPLNDPPLTFDTPEDAYVTWNGPGACLGGVLPTARTTWGRVKTLYRE